MHRALTGVIVLALAAPAIAQEIPRPEHPRPNAVRATWQNLNGTWQFRFDAANEGLDAGYFKPAAKGFDREIVVPFCWESELSGIGDTSGDSKIGWYRRQLTVPDTFPTDGRVWLRFEAVDWRADVWLNGAKVASHEGGYTPFEADITDVVKRDGENTLVVRAEDHTNPELPTGKQVGWYTTTSGIWQTVWLEARPATYLSEFVIRTEIEPAKALIAVATSGAAAEGLQVSVRSSDETVAAASSGFEASTPDTAQQTGLQVGESGQVARVEVAVKDATLWTPETPRLYPITLELKNADGKVIDSVETYFGLRSIARGKLPGDEFERILLNGKPVYLRGALDQSFNPEGIYTAPDDEFLKRDIYLAKVSGLNFLRIHIKSEEPRRLYWADQMGMLIMQDMPNTWRQNAIARETWEATMRATVVRDRNHPSIFAWVAFNETWGLAGRERERGRGPSYMEDNDTQQWVKDMVAAIRQLDPTRLVEDNSPCNYDHVAVTDLNSWHFYIDDHENARQHIANVVEQTFPGSTFNSCPGEPMNSAPLINSEYGGVSAGGGDRDISWCFRDLTTLLRKHNKIQGYIYTELSDIEWEHNGFFNYDRTPKFFGYEEWLPEMWVNELQQPDFVGYDAPPAIVAKPGETIEVPVFISHYSDRDHPVKLRWWLQGWDERGNIVMAAPPVSVPATWEKYQVTWQEPIKVTVPDHPFVGALVLTLRQPADPPGSSADPRFAVNFVNVVVKPDEPAPRVVRRNDHEALLRFRPEDYARSVWTSPALAPEGKVYGRGTGSFEYHVRIPEAVLKARPDSYFLRFEAAAKADRERVDWPLRENRQDYPQSDGRAFPSTLRVTVNGAEVLTTELGSDRADARGVLSHLNRVEHGSYGDLIEVAADLPAAVLAELDAGKPLVIRLEVPRDAQPAGGLAIFGANTGMFPFDPTLEIHTTETLPEDLGVDPSASVAVDVAVARLTPLLIAGDASRDAPPEWAYTTEDPGEGWEAPDFDDTAWKRGQPGFGTDGTPAIRVRTRWDTDRIWARATFEMPELAAQDVVTLRLFHDEDVQVSLNGHELYRESGHDTAYEERTLSTEQTGWLKPGRNVVAVHCRQTTGGQGVDVGLSVLKAESGP